MFVRLGFDKAKALFRLDLMKLKVELPLLINLGKKILAFGRLDTMASRTLSSCRRIIILSMDNIQQIGDAVKKGL